MRNYTTRWAGEVWYTSRCGDARRAAQGEPVSYQSEPVTMWFDRRIVLRKSPIQGAGTFATEAIRAGELLILVTGGLVYSSEDWRAGRVRLDGDLYNEERLGDGLLIATPKAFHYYINHSCDGNAVDQTRNPRATQYIAWRDIAADEEITTDYGLYGAALEPCACGSPRCRGRVTPDDWRLPALQERYRSYLAWPQ